MHVTPLALTGGGAEADTRSVLYVCLCLAISDREINRQIDEGARTLDDLREGIGAGSVCSGCRAELIALLEARGGVERRVGGGKE